MAQTFQQWLEATTGYKSMTTFWDDFSIAERFGVAAVQDTYNRAFKEWRSDYKYLTEFVIVLNHKIWQHYELAQKAHAQGNNTQYLVRQQFASIYDRLWREADEWACNNLKGDEMSYYYETTD